MQQADQLWHQVQEALQASLSKPTFETWIRPARCRSYEQGQVELDEGGRRRRDLSSGAVDRPLAACATP